MKKDTAAGKDTCSYEFPFRTLSAAEEGVDAAGSCASNRVGKG